MKRKVCVVVTARPSYSRVRSALRAIVEHPELELQLVVAASALLERYGIVADVIEQDGFEITAKVYMVIEGENLVTSAKSAGLGLVELATVFDNLKPDVVVTIADRYETLGTAVAASYMNIPVAHIQGGEVTGSIDEKVRHAVTKLSNLHFVSTELAGKNVIRMGEEPSTVFVTGCPSIDLAAEMMEQPELDFDPFTKYGGVGPPLEIDRSYLVVLQHPVTTEYHEAFEHANQTLGAIRDLAMPTLWFWPNVDAGSDGTSKALRMFRENEQPSYVHWFRNVLPDDFLRLALNASCMVGNSSVAIRECSFLGVPAVNVGTRQIGRERGLNVVDVDYDQKAIAEAIRERVYSGRGAPDLTYGDGQAGSRIAKHLAECELQIEKRLRY